MTRWNPQRLLPVRPGEGALVSWSLIYFFCLLTACVTVEPPEPDKEGLPVIDCGQRAIHITPRDGSATLYLPGGVALSLPRVDTDAGRRYATAGHAVQYRDDGRARLQLPGETHEHCTLTRAFNPWASAWLRGVHFRAEGSDADWLLEITAHRHMVLVRNGGNALKRPTPDTLRDGERFIYEDEKLRVEVLEHACRTTGDNRYPYAVRITLNGKALHGCGRGLMPVEEP